MGVGVNIGNTLDNTTQWETGWGNPRITKEYVESLAKLGFKTVRVPVAWVGVGERVQDLRRFDPKEFVSALFEPV